MRMASSSINARFFLLFSMWHMRSLCFATAASTLSSNHSSIKDGETLVSANKLFHLGFMNPSLEGPKNYVGIWHTNDLQNNLTVWVANRENPLDHTTGILTLKADGNLVVSYENGTVVWSTNVPAQSANSSIAVLGDNGNLVVREESSGAVLWESFDEPFDTLIPGMKIGINLRTGRTRMLTAKRSEFDPSPGMYSFGIDPQDPNQFFIWRGSVPYWRVFFWNGTTYNINRGEGVQPINESIENASVVRTDDEVYFTLSLSSPTPLRRLVIGSLANLTSYEEYVTEYLVGTRPCSTDGACGPNSSCNENQDPMCKCLPGFKPQSLASWNKGEWREGCTLTQQLQCGDEDGFLTLRNAKLPMNWEGQVVDNASMCKQRCNDEGCSCTAFAWVKNDSNRYACYLWREELKDLEEDVYADYRMENASLEEVNVRVVSPVLSREGRKCGTCGTYIIPYPLSTEPSCGDPAYNSFYCNSSSGLLYFRVPDGLSYPISKINPETRTFVIKPKGIDLCWAGSDKLMDINLNRSLPFYVTNNNTVLLLNCSTIPDKILHLNCSSSSLCYRYIQEGRAPCFHSNKCCSYVTGGSNSMTSHKIGVLDNQCGSYASIITLDSLTNASTIYLDRNLSLWKNEWQEGVQIAWNAPSEPICDSYKDCSAWPNSSCRIQNVLTRKRCLCDEYFQWDPLSMNCMPDSTAKNTSFGMPEQLNLIVTAVAGIGMLLIAAFTYGVQRSKKKIKVSFPTNELLELANENDNVEVPFVDFKCIVEATENFSDSHKIGRGGFGPVYKGKFQGGQELAIKRLSKCSGQGLEEFKNEILLITRLQHRNLVKMLGFCIEGDEKMLIYEYMPNKSLDFFLFDPNRRAFLNWEKRFNIILGVARGLLYLHQDSRLRIIHRDLKTSNILLDKDMNPKISDFGLARIFVGDQAQEMTNRVAGTYGYMAPEYAANGLFSMKSDVFSFGIILTEIISGQKNVDFYNHGHASNLTGYAWQLWNDGDGLKLLDSCLCDSNNSTQVLRCLQLALLCVQENADDRPTMASVLVLLESETASLPTPKQPAFIRSRFPGPLSTSPSQAPKYSNNELTLSTLEGR